MADSDITDEMLTAFLDEELSVQDREFIERQIAQSDEVAARLGALEIDKSALRAAFQSVSQHPRIDEISASLEITPTEAATNSWRNAVAVAVFALALGLGLGQLLPRNVTQDQTPDWRLEVAHYQALYVPKTLDQIAGSPTELQAQFARAGVELGLDLTPKDFDDQPGFTLKRAQILGFGGQPLVQIAYTSAMGKPVAFCILKGNEQTSIDAMQSREMLGMQSVSWSGETHQFLLIGDIPEAEIKGLAHRLKQAL